MQNNNNKTSRLIVAFSEQTTQKRKQFTKKEIDEVIKIFNKAISGYLNFQDRSDDKYLRTIVLCKQIPAKKNNIYTYGYVIVYPCININYESRMQIVERAEMEMSECDIRSLCDYAGLTNNEWFMNPHHKNKYDDENPNVLLRKWLGYSNRDAEYDVYLSHFLSDSDALTYELDYKDQTFADATLRLYQQLQRNIKHCYKVKTQIKNK